MKEVDDGGVRSIAGRESVGVKRAPDTYIDEFSAFFRITSRLGLAVLPLHGKGAFQKGWPTSEPLSEEDLESHLKREPTNFGIRPADCVEVDGSEPMHCPSQTVGASHRCISRV